MAIRLAAVATVVALANASSAQRPLAEIQPTEIDVLGWVLYNVGDVDGDGHDDLANACAGRWNDQEWFSRLSFHSGATRKWLGQIEVAGERFDDGSSNRGDACGEALVVLRRDAAGFEFAIGAPGTGHDGTATGVVETFTKLDEKNSRLRWKGNAGHAEFGAALATVGDLDGDDLDDLAVGAPGDRDGCVAVYSGKDGRPLRYLSGWERPGRFGAALAATLDVDETARHRRLAIGCPDASLSREASDHTGAVCLYSLGDGKLVRSVMGSAEGEHFGARIVSADLDSDGRPELIVGSLGGGEKPTLASVSLIANGSATRKWTAKLAAQTTQDGLRIASCADLDGDQVGEVLVTIAPTDRSLRPEFLVLSGGDGSVLHAIRGIDASMDDSTEVARRAYRSDDLGLALGRRLCAIDAGDQDGDGVHDVWFAVHADPDGPLQRSGIALFSGCELGAKQKAAMSAPVPTITIGAAPKRADSAGDTAPTLHIEKLEKLMQLEMGDAMSAEARGGACSTSAFGKRIRALGDLNGDERDELWVSGIAQGWGEYYSYVFAGATSRQLTRQEHGDFNDAVRIGDVDGDSHDDIVIAASERTYRFCEAFGVALVVSSKSWKEVKKLKDEGGAYEFAAALATIGDVDGDGARDLAVGTPAAEGWGTPNASKASSVCKVDFVACGKELGKIVRTLLGSADGVDGFGRALAYGGDWDGDGVPDLAVGAPRDNRRAPLAGSVHIYSGATWRRLALFTSEIANESFGRQLAWAGDLDGDGHSELVVAAPLSCEDTRGRVVVLSSKAHSVSWEARGERLFAAFGASLAVGDLDGDGIDELVVGAPGIWHEGELAPGSVSILSMRDGRVLTRIVGESIKPQDWMDGVEWSSNIAPYSYGDPALPLFGSSLAIARDLNGDHVCDLVIGAPTYCGPEFAGAIYAISGAKLREAMTK